MAISAAYPGLDHADPIGTAAAIARGFHAGYPLLEEEVGLLYDLIAIRLVTSVTISASRRSHMQDNPYLAISGSIGIVAGDPLSASAKGSDAILLPLIAQPRQSRSVPTKPMTRKTL
ncbi:Uncharacterised protein [Brucella anthropi]|nr:Uncharacterised protein [Brucella anthropi]